MIVALKNLFFKKELLAVFVVAIVLSLVIFGNGLFNDFNFFVSPYHHLEKIGLFRPFSMASYAVNNYINDAFLPASASSFQQAAGFRVVNIIIHALNSFLVFWLVRHLFKNRFLSYATLILFLVHSIHTEAFTSLLKKMLG